MVILDHRAAATSGANNSIAAIDYAKSLGMDVIVTDHHLPKDQLPNADAIVNPNKGECGSGMNHLSGTGVAFYLILALKSKIKPIKRTGITKDICELIVPRLMPPFWVIMAIFSKR